MRTFSISIPVAVALSALLLAPTAGSGQPPGGKGPKPPPDEFKALVKEVEEAYKAPVEVDKDILDELRKQYRDPTPQREDKILREARRLYNLTPEQELDIVRELRRAYEQRSPQQEERVFAQIRRNGRLPEGTVPLSVQERQAEKLFRGFDRSGDGRLDPEEMPDALLAQLRTWDRNRDGLIDFDEYAAYYQAHLRSVSDRVASGELQIKLPKGVVIKPPRLPAGGPALPMEVLAVRFGKLPPGLPAWFAELDTDRDGQVGLYEWRAAGRPNGEFERMDRNGDFLLTPGEVLLFLAEERARAATAAASNR